jgi:hypothetical protein
MFIAPGIMDGNIPKCFSHYFQYQRDIGTQSIHLCWGVAIWTIYRYILTIIAVNVLLKITLVTEVHRARKNVELDEKILNARTDAGIDPPEVSWLL